MRKQKLEGSYTLSKLKRAVIKSIYFREVDRGSPWTMVISQQTLL